MAFPIRFLIDECVSPNLVSEARARSFDAWHVNHRALNRQPDLKIFRACQSDDLTLVTNNARDFLPLYSGVDVHPGVVILLPSVNGEAQLQLFRVALDWIADQTDLINKLVEVDVKSAIKVSDFPTP